MKLRKFIFLVGMPGSGKSRLSAIISEKLNIERIDTDEELAKKFDMSISDIVDRYGESDFREKERSILAEILQNEPCIVSCGGGLPIHFSNMQDLKNAGLVIYLQSDIKTIFNRISKDIKIRPLINRDYNWLKSLYEERKTIYEKSHIIIKENELDDNFFIDLFE